MLRINKTSCYLFIYYQQCERPTTCIVSNRGLVWWSDGITTSIDWQSQWELRGDDPLHNSADENIGVDRLRMWSLFWCANYIEKLEKDDPYTWREAHTAYLQLLQHLHGHWLQLTCIMGSSILCPGVAILFRGKLRAKIEECYHTKEHGYLGQVSYHLSY